MRMMRNAWINNLTSLNYVHTMMVIVKMVMVMMNHDCNGDKEHVDDGGWHIMDVDDDGYNMIMTMMRHDGDCENDHEDC